MSWWSRLVNVFRSGDLDHDLDDELQFHIEERIRAFTADGMTHEEATAQAVRRFGSRLRIREESRDMSFTLPLAVLLLIVLLSAAVPAVRAARTDPVTALRCE